jgi:hypothetical protein
MQSAQNVCLYRLQVLALAGMSSLADRAPVPLELGPDAREGVASVLPLVPGINAAGSARRKDHWRSVVVVVVGAADPQKRVICRFTPN